MKRRKRRTFSAEFKARVALEAVRGLKAINEIAADHEVHPVQVSAWKRELVEGLPRVFASQRRADEAAEKERAGLEKKIGQLTVEVDWLRKKSKDLGL